MKAAPAGRVGVTATTMMGWMDGGAPAEAPAAAVVEPEGETGARSTAEGGGSGATRGSKHSTRTPKRPMIVRTMKLVCCWL